MTEIPPTFAAPYADCLTDVTREALYETSAILPGVLLDDLGRLVRWAGLNGLVDDDRRDLPIGDTDELAWLPQRAWHRLTYLDCKKYVAAVIHLTGRLNDGEDASARCTADELAVHHLISCVSDPQPGSARDLQDFDDWMEAVVQDTDALLLFDRMADGIEDYGEKYLGLGPKELDVSSWFRPFLSNVLPVHPYLTAPLPPDGDRD